MIQDIQAVQAGLENEMIRQADSLADAVKKLPEAKRIETLTTFSNTWGETVHHRWQDLGAHLITKYNDGYVKDEKGKIEEAPYPDAWLEQINTQNSDKHKLPQWNADKKQKHLPY
jgi:hypothetical protein